MNPTKKVAILADFPTHLLPDSPSPTPHGHFATWLPQLATSLEKDNNFEFHWLTLDPEISKPLRLSAWSQSFHVLPTMKKGRAATLFWDDRRRIQQKLRQINPDLVPGWGNENIWGWATVSSQRPHLLSVQGLLGVYGKLGRQHFRERLMARIERFVLQKAKIITTESPWARERIQEQTGRNDIRLVEYGVADPFFEADHRPDPNHPFALMVGTADYRKGIDFAVELFSRPGLADFRLKIVGGVTPYAESYKKKSPPNIEWLGRKSQTEIISLMTGAACLILPTRADVCANVVKEARVMGLPVVASPHGGHIQYLVQGRNGWVFDLNEPEKWEQGIRALTSSNSDDAGLGKYRQAEDRALLAPQKTASEFLKIYREMVG
jgi:glycosyltransferase involved in cell wall biosynthesis